MSDPISCDVIVLGLGPGGQMLATKLAEAGVDTVGVVVIYPRPFIM